MTPRAPAAFPVPAAPGARRAGAAAYSALAALALVWGYSWVAVKVATRDASPLVVAALRTGLGALALFAWMGLRRLPSRRPPVVATAVYGLLQTAAFTLLQTLAVSMGGAGRAAVLAYTMPFWLALLAWPFLGERIRGWRWLALALAAVGLALIVTPLSSRSAPASALAVAAGLVWAASAVLAVRLRAAGASDVLSLSAWQMAFGAAALGALALLLPGHVRLTASFLAAIAFLSLLATALGWALWLFILSRLPATVAGVASLATPALGVALSAIQLGEIPSARELSGVTLVVGALVLNWWASAPPGSRVSRRGSSSA
ncbi:MAG TPA: DMT family transporter [Anaeromyxobacteraceae bacterium]|nr:DMT family transporter [Anaeromyxobacteraceae bacterium]